MKDAPRGRSSKARGEADCERSGAPAARGQGSEHRWTFLSNHAYVLVCLRRDPDIRLREVAQLIGITERAVQSIIADLELEGLVRRRREGRRNSYELNLEHPLRHPLEQHCSVRDLMRLILKH